MVRTWRLLEVRMGGGGECSYYYSLGQGTIQGGAGGQQGFAGGGTGVPIPVWGIRPKKIPFA